MKKLGLQRFSPALWTLFSAIGAALTHAYIGSRRTEWGQLLEFLERVALKVFGGFPGQPSINNNGDIAFHETLTGSTTEGIFVGRNGSFKTILSSPNLSSLKTNFGISHL